MGEVSDLTDARTRVLQALQAAGPAGLTTWSLIHAAQHSRAVGRIWELQQDWRIDKAHEGGRVYRWTLRGPRVPGQQPLFAELP